MFISSRPASFCTIWHSRYPTYLLTTSLEPDQLQQLEGQISSLTRDINEAHIVLGKISRRERALFELRRLKLLTEEVSVMSEQAGDDGESKEDDSPRPKRPRLSSPLPGNAGVNLNEDQGGGISTSNNTIMVVKLAWWLESQERGSLLPIEDYVLYRGRKLPAAQTSSPVSVKSMNSDRILSSPVGKSSSSRLPGTAEQFSPHRHRRVTSQPPPLPRETTSEHDVPLPSIPDFLHTTYSCQRPTPGDQIGVRAYSSSIAALSAYPHLLQTATEVGKLPGCGAKIAELYQQWKDRGTLQEIEEGRSNDKLRVLKLFYDIWGVGDTTARDFYNKGWRDLDDIVEHGWDTLSRVQQIGVKYYDELQQKIPRSEVEGIGEVILAHARAIDAGFQMAIVGGYRRGSSESGDVDVILSHADAAATLHFISKILVRLEQSGHVTHTLTLSTRNSERGQAPLPWRGEGRKGSGFDTLDKAMVVWRDPNKGRDEEAAPHRRVDIIVSPWRTTGCAMLGWSGGTTFERDLRRYCKAELGLKFDSSGIRSRRDGSWVDLEGDGSAPDMEVAERRVFEGLKLPWRRPEERCTG
uniref:DNA polymerase n=1 Tax=Bionectria ochroleuca TaxID=29856 RepID=A0A8H7N4P1_BIOOC